MSGGKSGERVRKRAGNKDGRFVFPGPGDWFPNYNLPNSAMPQS